MTGDTLREECGVSGIWGHPHAVTLTHYALYALQHRGQESAGIAAACSGDDGLKLHRGLGLVAEVFGEETLESLRGDCAVGHVRYATTGNTSLRNAQPLVVRLKSTSLGLAHNGNLTNAARLRRCLEGGGSIFQSTSDTEVIAHLTARARPDEMGASLLEALQEVRGGYALVALTPGQLFAARDPAGIRPLCLGKLGDGWMVASETCALDTAGATFVRDVAPGELLCIDDKGLTSLRITGNAPPALCIFEYIYFARPDSNLQGHNVHQVRKELGRLLAMDHPVDADVVSGVPASSLSAATGYAEQAGIPYEMGLVRNRYIGRTFIQPGDELRKLGVRLKLNPLRKVVEGRRVVLVDDSIVRGTTSKILVELLRAAGAEEIHLRISSPPYRYPCYYGIDTSSKGELIAAGRTVEEIRAIVGADSLAYLDEDRVAEAAGGTRSNFCTACFDGDYPVPPEEIDEDRLEEVD